MVTKEQCEQALRNLETINLDIVLDELGYEKAEMVSWYGMNDYPTLEKQGDIDVLRELIEEHFNKNALVKCEKCGKEMPYVLVNKFNYSGSDSFLKYSYNRIGGCVSIVADRNWTGYELSEEEILETIVCPHCGKYPFQSKEIHVYDEVEIVMFPKENEKC